MGKALTGLVIGLVFFFFVVQLLGPDRPKLGKQKLINLSLQGTVYLFGFYSFKTRMKSRSL